MAAPHALLVPDIVEEIVDRAAVVGSRRESKQLLARLARVSSIFRDPALRRLWAELMFLDPLFRILTNCHRNLGALKPDSVEDDDPEANSVERMLGHTSREDGHARFRLTLHGNILTQDIVRFQHYAALIRVLRISRRVNVSSLEPPSWDALVQQAGDPLLPSLRELTLPVMPPYPVQSRFHVSPSLRELTITFPKWDIVSLTDNIQNLFDSLFARAPQLTRLRIESETYMYRRMEDELFHPWCYNGKWELERRTGEQAQGAFSAALSSVDQLQHLELFHMIAMNTAVADASLLRALSLLPNLHDVAFGIHVCEQAIRSVQPGFQHLTSLALSNVHRGDELQVFNSPLLHSLSIYHTESPNVDECLRTLTSIGQRFAHIRRLVWKAPFRPEHLGNGMDIFVSLVRPMFSLHALETLDLDIGVVTVHDRDIATLAAGLPHLQDFKLKVYKSEHDRRAGLTAGALLALAQGCPGLVSLYMEGVYVPESDYPAIERYFFGHGLRSLYIAGLEFKAESYCAMIVDMIFPYLDIAECRKRVKEMYWPCESWVAIVDKLEAFHATR
ncbi:hypothetical protein C8Q74DRAFT_1278635 [Fomes fomentarius]|nr:hypothetical protein C8Q74DRAFT_1278635 [Fomes fomentarius]